MHRFRTLVSARARCLSRGVSGVPSRLRNTAVLSPFSRADSFLPPMLAAVTHSSCRMNSGISNKHRSSLLTRNRSMNANQHRPLRVPFVSSKRFLSRLDNEALLSRLRAGLITKGEVTDLILENEALKSTGSSSSASSSGNSSYTVSGAGSKRLGYVGGRAGEPALAGSGGNLGGSHAAMTSAILSAGSGGGTGLRGLGSKANPVYMRKQTSFKEVIFSLFPFLFIFWILGGFDLIKNRKTGGVGGGMFGKNFTEWDEEDWEDDDDFDDDDEDESGEETMVFDDIDDGLDLLSTDDSDDSEDILRKAARKRREKKLRRKNGKKDSKKSGKDEIDEEALSLREKWWRRLGIRLNNDVDNDDDSEESGSDKISIGGSDADGSSKKKKKKQKRVRFKDVCGCEEGKADLTDLVDYLKNPAKYQAMGCKLPKGVLMSGPPGNGKTLLARALAGEAGVPFLATNGASFDEIFVGVGVMRVRKLFERAKEKAPCIVFIDEIDAIANTRMQMGTAHSSDSLNALLSEMDGFEQNTGIIVIAATNMPDKLDPALVRPGRFDRKVAVTPPDKPARMQIVKKYLNNRESQNVDIDLLVSDIAGFSGAELESMVNIASIEAVKKGVNEIDMDLLIEAKEIISMGRARRSMNVSAKTQKVTAYHESGHAIVALYTKGSKPIYKATILPRGQALGFVASVNDDEYMSTKEALLAQMDICMGGRASEEIFGGVSQVTTGASSDFNQATRIATAMVCQYGMSKKIGKVFYQADDIPNLSPSLRNDINSEVKRLLDESYQRASKLLLDHRNDIELLAETLLEKETLSAEQIKEVIKYDPSKIREPTDFTGMTDASHPSTKASSGYTFGIELTSKKAQSAKETLDKQIQHSGLLTPQSDLSSAAASAL